MHLCPAISLLRLHKQLGTKVLMPWVDYASLQPCCSLSMVVCTARAVQCSEPGLCSSCCNELFLYVLCK